MRKWALFLLLATAIAGAAWWHYSRIPSPSAASPQGLEAVSATQEWDPEALRQTRGEIVIGGGEVLPSATPSAAGADPAAPAAKPQPAAPAPGKPAELLSKNAPAAPVPGEESYTVQKGDTLGAIAKKKYGSAAPRFVDAILKKNGLKNPDALKIGAKLVLPDPASLKK